MVSFLSLNVVTQMTTTKDFKIKKKTHVQSMHVTVNTKSILIVGGNHPFSAMSSLHSIGR